MRPASRPTHWRLSPDEQAQNDAEHQRGSEIGFLTALLLPLTPILFIAAAQIISAIRGL